MYLIFARPILRYRLEKLKESYSNLRTMINYTDTEAAELKNLLLQYPADSEMKQLAARLDSFVIFNDNRLAECIAERHIEFEYLEDDSAIRKLFESIDHNSIPME